MLGERTHVIQICHVGKAQRTISELNVNGCDKAKIRRRMQTKGGVRFSQGGLERREGLGLGGRSWRKRKGQLRKSRARKLCTSRLPAKYSAMIGRDHPCTIVYCRARKHNTKQLHTSSFHNAFLRFASSILSTIAFAVELLDIELAPFVFLI